MKLETVADEDEGCPVVGMGEGARRELSRTVETNASIRETRRFAIECFGVGVGELAVDEGDLDLAEGFGFAEVAFAEGLVEAVHEEAGGGVIY